MYIIYIRPWWVVLVRNAWWLIVHQYCTIIEISDNIIINIPSQSHHQQDSIVIIEKLNRTSRAATILIFINS
jgi:hypothetical protein